MQPLSAIRSRIRRQKVVPSRRQKLLRLPMIVVPIALAGIAAIVAAVAMVGTRMRSRRARQPEAV